MLNKKKGKKRVTVYTHEGRIIREACNHLPMGICVGTLEGIPRLTNESMQQLAYLISGKNITNTVLFWQDLEDFQGNDKADDVVFTDTPSIRLKDGRIINFTKRNITIKNIKHEEILANDVTDKYEVSQKLKSENQLLKKQAEELDQLRENIATLNRDEEVLEQKIRVHYELGRVILSSRRYIMGESGVDKAELMEMWDDALGVFENPLFSEKASFDFIGEMKAMAQGNGCTMEFEGPFDSESDLFTTVVREGLVNAVRHGNATEVRVVNRKLSDEEKIAGQDTYLLQVIDNGKGLDEENNHKGGLEDLEAMLKEKGGSLKLYNRPDAQGTILETIVVYEA